MFVKLLTALVLAVLIGSAVFSLRQQRLELMHEITSMHRQMNRDRQATWDSQVRIADHTTPKALRDAIARTGMDMEPTAAQPQLESVLGAGGWGLGSGQGDSNDTGHESASYQSPDPGPQTLPIVTHNREATDDAFAEARYEAP